MKNIATVEVEAVNSVKQGTSFCKLGDEYSLSINIVNSHVLLSSAAHPHQKGCDTEITFFGLTPEDMLRMADNIRNVVGEIIQKEEGRLIK